MIAPTEHIVILDGLVFPDLNIKRTANLAIAPANYFGMAFGLFMIAAPMMSWIDYRSPTLGAALCFGGICEYIFGFLNWYQHRTIQSFIDFVFGLLHLTVFYTTDLGMYQIPVPIEYHTYMQGVFYIFWFVMLLIVMISLKDRGILYMVIIFFLAIASIFVFIGTHPLFPTSSNIYLIILNILIGTKVACGFLIIFYRFIAFERR